MATTNSENQAKEQITFFADHRPALEDGDYTITITQRIETQDDSGTKKAPPQKITNQKDFTVTRNFSVSGPRFSLDPQEIQGVFPPEGSLGEHSNVLPHVILKRATLPWERYASSKDGKPPWLALLVFHDSEEPLPVSPGAEIKIPALQTVTLQDIGFPKNKDIDSPKNQEWGQADTSKVNGVFNSNITPESGQHPDDLVQIITVSGDFLKAIIPSKDELKWLAHVRQSTDAHGKPTEPFAVVFANRLPIPGGHTTVHLVSLENIYANGDFFEKNKDKNICLVSLKSWRFACVSADHDFKNLLLNLDNQTLHLPSKGTQSEPYTAKGMAPFTHFMRQGNRSVSWYRGPLIPGENAGSEPDLPAKNADSLVRFYQNIGMFDVSYAAAWELGRLLTLQNKGVSVDLFNWKRGHAQQQRDAEYLLEHHKHLPGVKDAPEMDLPVSVHNWFLQLSLLNGIPFNYLVPDEKMLPTESIRFFQVDPIWIECLLDGAFAVGRVLSSDHTADKKTRAADAAPTHPTEHEQISGFLLRSSIVAGYPDLLIDGYIFINDETGESFNNISISGLPAELIRNFETKGLSLPKNISIKKTENGKFRVIDSISEQLYYVLSYENSKIAIRLQLLRIDRLSPSVLLCLFAGKVERIDIHQKPEALHFGFDPTDTKPPDYYKKIRDLNGAEINNAQVPIQWRDQGKRVVSIDDFQEKMGQALQDKLHADTKNNWNVAQFAMEMLEGVEMVEFTINTK